MLMPARLNRSDLAVPANYQVWLAEPLMGSVLHHVATVEVPEGARGTIHEALGWVFARCQNIDAPVSWAEDADRRGISSVMLSCLPTRSLSTGDVLIPVESNVAFVVENIGFSTFVVSR